MNEDESVVGAPSKSRFAVAWSTARAIVAMASLAFLGLATARAEDWPQWRGAERDGQWHEQGALTRFPAGGPPVIWKVPVGPGYSGPTVSRGRAFLTDRVNNPQQERVLCFDEATGKLLWKDEYDAIYTISYRAGPRACVTVDGDVCFSLGAMGRLRCLDVADGRLIWDRDLDQDYQVRASKRMPIWGIASAPLVYRDLVIVQAAGADGACYVALEKQTGKEVWRALKDRASYSAPIMVRQGDEDVMVGWTGDSVAGLAPASGKVLWQHPFPSVKMPIGIATPVVEGNKLFVTSFYDGSLMLELDDQRPAVRELWARRGASEQDTDALQSIISTPLMMRGHIYGVDSYGELRCLKADSGDRVWEDLSATPKARWSNIHFVRNGETIWMFNERGELIVGSLDPQKFTEHSRAKIIEPTKDQLPQRGGVCWAHPAFANLRMFIRNDKELVCVDLAANRQSVEK
ncbi:MAG: PQQ-binding-like beta-propeller repeat protein [Planctomycetales bacterium]|nr:PQQ-binding-like beta-propeller repeat protein [Planctomycetales bacterium]